MTKTMPIWIKTISRLPTLDQDQPRGTEPHRCPKLGLLHRLLWNGTFVHETCETLLKAPCQATTKITLRLSHQNQETRLPRRPGLATNSKVGNFLLHTLCGRNPTIHLLIHTTIRNILMPRLLPLRTPTTTLGHRWISQGNTSWTLLSKDRSISLSDTLIQA